MVKTFILSNPNTLTSEQKVTTYQLAISYFTPSPHVLSDVLLLCLVKLGPDYIKIYAEEILKKIDHYGECIIKFKHLLNKQELT